MSEPTAAEEQAAADAMLDAQIDELLMEKYQRRIEDNLATPDEDDPNREPPVEVESTAVYRGLARPQPRTCGTMTTIDRKGKAVRLFCIRTTHSGGPHTGLHRAEVVWESE